MKGLAEAATAGTTHTGTTGKWFLYNLLEFSLPLACVAGAKREGGGGEREPSLPNYPSLFSFLPIPYTPFDACQASYLPLPLFVTPATQASSRMAF